MEFDRRTSKVEASGFDLAQSLRPWQRVHQSAIYEGGSGTEETRTRLSDQIPLKCEPVTTSIETMVTLTPSPLHQLGRGALIHILEKMSVVSTEMK
jgi:hypothetical protein